MAGGKIRTVHVTDLPGRFDVYSIGNPRKSGKDAVCGFIDSDHSRFVITPMYAFDAVAENEVANIGELKKYIWEHPNP